MPNYVIMYEILKNKKRKFNEMIKKILPSEKYVNNEYELLKSYRKS